MPAPFLMKMLKRHKTVQASRKLALGPAWNDGDFPNLVFTHPDGSHLSQASVWKILYKMLKNADLPHYRFHDLRHTYVVTSIHAGDDPIIQWPSHWTATGTLWTPCGRKVPREWSSSG